MKTAHRNKQHNAWRVMTSQERKQRLADDFRQKSVDRALRRALRCIHNVETNLDHGRTP